MYLWNKRGQKEQRVYNRRKNTSWLSDTFEKLFATFEKKV